MTAQKLITLTISDAPVLGASATQRDVDVVALSGSSEQKIRQWAWAEERAKIVNELSGGRVGYIYMPNTGPDGYSSFNRGQKQQCIDAFLACVALRIVDLPRTPQLGDDYKQLAFHKRSHIGQAFFRSWVCPHSALLLHTRVLQQEAVAFDNFCSANFECSSENFCCVSDRQARSSD